MEGIDRIDHICIAVKNLAKARATWERFLSREKPDREYAFEAESIEVARYNIGEVAFELMTSTREGSDLDRFLSGRGEGVFLISFKVENTGAAMKRLEKEGFRLLDEEPRVWEKSRYTFINPDFMNGVLVEIID